MIVCIIIIPIIVAILTSSIQSPIKNFVTSNDWIGFFGSYIGSILGGLITLFVMDETIKSGNENLNLNIKSNEKINESNEINRFCNNVAHLIGEYCSDISDYYYGCIESEEYDNYKKDLYDKLYKGEITEESYTYKLIILNLNKPKVNRSKSVAIYFKLEILLKEEKLAKDLIEILNSVHNTYSYLTTRFDPDKKQFEDEIENLLEKTRIFIKDYKLNNLNKLN